MELVREVLLKLEPLNAHFDNPIELVIGTEPLIFKKWTQEEVGYHIRIMCQGDLIAMSGIETDGVTITRYLGFRWLGHEFLDDVRDPKAWKKIKAAGKKIGGGSLAFMLDVAKAYGQHEIMKAFGVNP